MVPRKEDKPLAWDVTVTCPLAVSYVYASASNAGSLDRQPLAVAVESSRPINAAACSFLAELGWKISLIYGDDHNSSRLFLRSLLLSFCSVFTGGNKKGK